MTLEQCAEARYIRRELPGSSRGSFPHRCLFLVGPLQYALCFGLRFAQEQLGLLLGLCPAIHPQLLGRYQSFIHRSLPIAKSAQLFLRTSKPLLMLGTVTQKPFQLIRHGELELVNLRGVVPSESALELL
jgi:hypothetical protein